jgi:hypothetical protein
VLHRRDDARARMFHQRQASDMGLRDGAAVQSLHLGRGDNLHEAGCRISGWWSVMLVMMLLSVVREDDFSDGIVSVM